MTLERDLVPQGVSPPTLCTPSRAAGESAMAELVRSLPATSIQDVLDLGCGGGEYRFLFPGCTWLGLDLENNGFPAKTSARHRFVLATAAALPVRSESHDLVWSSYSFEYFSDPHAALQEIRRVLRPGGRAVLCVPTAWIKAYELIAAVARGLGVRVGEVSAQPGCRPYPPRRLAAMASANGLALERQVTIYGPLVLLCKIIQSWTRTALHLGARCARAVVGWPGHAALPLYVGRRVTAARDRAGWERELHAAAAQAGWRRRAGARLVALAARADRRWARWPVVEYLLLLRRLEG